jgi:DNA-3-methyladenine glycosylase I
MTPQAAGSTASGTPGPTRCPWPGADPLYCAYHDREWGVPLHDDRAFFELLVLEGAQAGLSWITILRRREAYRRAFERFDPRKVARFDDRRVAALLADAGLVRNRLKIAGAVRNARAFLDVQRECGSFDAYIWGFVGGLPRTNAWTKAGQVPSTTLESEAMSRELAKRGFTFVGPTICYALMQSAGLVNDHLTDCFRYREVARAVRAGH